MPQKKYIPSGEEEYWPAKLRISKEEFKKTLQERIDKWQKLFERQISNPSDFEILKTDYYKWDDWNKEYLKQSFNYQDNQYLKDYNCWWAISVWYWEPSFYQKIQAQQKDIKEKIEKLDRLLEKVDLIPVDENLKTTKEIKKEDHIFRILKILNWFHKCAQELRYRYSDRETITINDEYDVQDLLRSLLKIFYDDVRAEDFSPSNAWWNSRIDLILPQEKIIIETKMASERLKDKDLGEQILIDIWRYAKHPDYEKLVVFIYDKWDFVRNKKWLIGDLERQSRPWKEVIVIINPM